MNSCIAILATARTGTNYLVGLFEQGTSLECGAEIFHPNSPFGLDPALIADMLSIDISENIALSEQELAQRVRSESSLILNRIIEQGALDLFKIFPDHLPHDIVKEQILENDSFIKLVIDRNPIDVFISLNKARKVDQWDSYDTSSLKIELPTEKFFGWLHRNHVWYEAIRAAANKRDDAPFLFLHYDDISRRGPEALLSFLDEELSRLGKPLGLRQVNLDKLLRKQDQSIDYEQRVSNWAEFTTSVEKINPSILNIKGFSELSTCVA